MGESTNKEFVMLAFGRKVGQMCFALGGKHAKPDNFSMNFDLRTPPAVPRLMRASKAPARQFVLHVRGMRHDAKIWPSVVGPVTVDVVNLPAGPSASHVKNGKPVSPITAASNAYFDVSARCAFGAGFAAGGAYAAPALDGLAPKELSSFWVVVQKLAQTLRGKIVASHEALQLRIGQRPTSVASAASASLF